MRTALRLVLCLALCALLSLAGACGEAANEPAETGAESPAATATQSVEVVAFEGDATETTEPFTLQGGEQSMEIHVVRDLATGGRASFAIESVIDGGFAGDPWDSGTFAPSEGEEVSGSSYLQLEAGDYHLVVDCAGSVSWSVTVYEMR